jgi:hypothetical protein
MHGQQNIKTFVENNIIQFAFVEVLLEEGTDQ